MISRVIQIILCLLQWSFCWKKSIREIFVLQVWNEESRSSKIFFGIQVVRSKHGMSLSPRKSVLDFVIETGSNVDLQIDRTLRYKWLLATQQKCYLKCLKLLPQVCGYAYDSVTSASVALDLRQRLCLQRQHKLNTLLKFWLQLRFLDEQKGHVISNLSPRLF